MDPRNHGGLMSAGEYHLNPSDQIRELLQVDRSGQVHIRPGQSSVHPPFGAIGISPSPKRNVTPQDSAAWSQAPRQPAEETDEYGFPIPNTDRYGFPIPPPLAQAEYAQSALAGLMDQDQPEFTSQLPSKQDMTARYGYANAQDFGYAGEQAPAKPQPQNSNPGYRKWDNYHLPSMLGSPFASR